MKVEEIMTKNVITLKPSETIRQAIQKFAKNRISGAPVVDDENNVIGILTEKDILKSLRTRYTELRMVYPSLPIMGISFVEVEKQKELFEALKEIGDMHVLEVMHKDVITVMPTDLVEDSIPIMVSKGINRLPVVDPNKKLVGIITRCNVIIGLSKTERND